METLHYVVPATSYPRYDYSKRHISCMHDRFKILMNNLQLDCRDYVIPEYGDVDIFVTRGDKTKEYIDERFLELKQSENVKVENKGRCTFKDIEDLIKRNEITDLSSKLVVVSISSASEVEPYSKYPHNVVIVAEDASLVDKIKHKIGTSDDNVLQVAVKKSLGNTICLMLERIVFRNLTELIDVLKGLSDVAKHGYIGKIVTKDIQETMKSTLKDDHCFKGWLEELDERYISTMHPELANYIPTDTTSLSRSKNLISKDRFESRNPRHLLERTQSSEQSSENINSGRRETQPVPAYLNCVSNIEERYTKGNEVLYYLVYKLASLIGITTEQSILAEYRKLPHIFRDILRLNPDSGTIRKIMIDHVCELFVTCIGNEIQVQEDDSAEDLLLIFLRSKTKNIMRGITKVTGQLEFVETVDKVQAVVKEEDDRSITRLLGDIIGMYYRSKVPLFERPTSGRSEGKRLNEKVAKHLFESVEKAKGCGYRYNKLHVYVEETDDENEREELEKKIRHILVSHNVSDCIVSTTTKTVTHFVEVGDGIRVTRSGTLGGFALMGQQHILCALLSKHVVNGASDVYLGETKIGCMISARGVINADLGFVDVAAAKIIDAHQTYCDTSFKDSFGRSLISALCEFDDADIPRLTGLPVHICGASTKLGVGTITMPEYFVRVKDKIERLVLVEDIEGRNGQIQRFCKEGDSGAIVCADDPDGDYIHVISMVIGSKTYLQFKDNPQIKGEYLSFRMTSGFSKLESEVGHHFMLCS